MESPNTVNTQLLAKSDTQVQSNEPNRNFGDQRRLSANNSNGVRVVFVRYDLGGLNQQIVGLKLELKIAEAEPGQEYNIYGLVNGESWNEKLVSWSNAPAVNPDFDKLSGWIKDYLRPGDLYMDGKPIATFISGMAGTTDVALDVTRGPVLDFIAADLDKIVTFVIVEAGKPDGSGVFWNSREATNSPPVLTVITLPPPPPPYWSAGRVGAVAGIVVASMAAAIGFLSIRRKREEATRRREFDAVLAERGRLAREIHDSLAQGLTSISMQLECIRDEMESDPASASQHVEIARTLVRTSLREARHTVWNLRPLALGEADLTSALQQLVTDLSRDGKTSIRLEIEGKPRPVPPAEEAALLRIGQESLTNAVRHSGAAEIRVHLGFAPEWVRLLVTDNGCGFDLSARVGEGFGLTGIHERVVALNGSLTIDSKPGEGTSVSTTFLT